MNDSPDADPVRRFDPIPNDIREMPAAGNAHPKPAQRPARHSDITLTMSRDPHTRLTDEATALNAPPEFPPAFDSARPEVQTLEATVTDGRGVKMSYCPAYRFPKLFGAFPGSKATFRIRRHRLAQRMTNS